MCFVCSSLELVRNDGGLEHWRHGIPLQVTIFPLFTCTSTLSLFWVTRDIVFVHVHWIDIDCCSLVLNAFYSLPCLTFSQPGVPAAHLHSSRYVFMYSCVSATSSQSSCSELAPLESPVWTPLRQSVTATSIRFTCSERGHGERGVQAVRRYGRNAGDACGHLGAHRRNDSRLHHRHRVPARRTSLMIMNICTCTVVKYVSNSIWYTGVQ